MLNFTIIFPWDVIDDHRSNFLEQINFVKNLKCNIQELLITRLYHIENQFDFEEKIWKKDFCHLSIDRNIFL